MRNKGKYLYSVFYLVVLFAVSGCSGKLSVQAKSDMGADIQFSASVGQVISSTLSSLSSSIAGGKYSGGSQNLFSATEIKKAFNGSDFTDVTVTTPSSDSLNMSASIPSASKQTHATGGIRASDIVNCTSNKMVLQFSPTSLQKLSADLPKDTKTYLDLFMAPVFTGEKMDKSEYKMLIASIYGDQIASELDKAQITVSLSCPKGKKISSTSLPSGAKVTSSSATFDLPLMDLLTLSGSRSYSISW
ncbi:MAG: hypothetical protein J5857_09210 [Treponema sp.]|nr:hypothetical protein [Treponema sp.]